MQVTQLKTGTIFKLNNDPYVVLKYTHTKVARGGATVKVKAKNLKTGSVLEKGYGASAKVEDADVFKKKAQYLYKDNGYVFMDPFTYDQFAISKDIVGDTAKFLTDNADVQVMYFEDTPMAVELPIKLTFTVKSTPPGHKGNTVSTVFKDATLDNGAVVKVPSFIKVGDRVTIDTRSGEYVSKG
jgi:elongation factor P